MSLIGTRLFQKRAYRAGLFDQPNARSSHTTPTPRGAGLIFSLITIGAWATTWKLNVTATQLAIPLIFPGLLVTLTGFIDDLTQLNRRARLAIQFVAALALIALTYDPSNAYYFNIWTLFITCIAIVWLINLYNFMDGIDGMAALYGITVSILASIALATSGNTAGILVFLPLAASLTGFIIFNWPPAKVFMGDAGSTFLGYSFAATAILFHSIIPWSGWAILLACFITDTSWTLAVRIFTGQAWAAPHRSHAYQKLSQRLNNHTPITLAYSAITLIWLFPIFCFHQYGDLSVIPALLLAYTPIIVMCRKASAGNAPGVQ